LWLTVGRQERDFVTTRFLIAACISAEATTNSQTCWSQQNMSVVPVICENQQCQNVQGDGQRPNWEPNFGELTVVGSDRRVEGDYWQDGNGGQIKQEGFVSNIIHHTRFIEGQRSVEEECMSCLWTDNYINKFVFRSHFNRCTTGGVTQTYRCTITQSSACTKHTFQYTNSCVRYVQWNGI